MVATLYEWLLFLHILAAMVWIGGLAALSLFGVSVLRNHDREAVARFVGDLRVVGPMLLAPSSVLVVGLGIWMVADDEAWGFGQTWIWLALALVGTAVLVGAVFLSRYALAAGRAVDAGNQAEAVRHLTRWALGIGSILVILVVVTWDMVFKPGL